MVSVTLPVMKVPDQKGSEPLSKEKGKVGSSFVESSRRERSSFVVKNDEAHHGNELACSGINVHLQKNLKFR